MSDEKSQQQTSTESTVAGAAKAGKAISNIAKGAAAGGAHGAAIEAGKSSAKWLIPLIAAVLLPLILVAMLPSIIFGSLLGDGTDSPNGISNDEVLVQNMTAINEGISSILSEGLTDVLERIDSDFASSGCDGKEINNPFGADVVFNANAFVSQYCAHKDTEIASISKKDMEALLTANKDKLYSFAFTDEEREIPPEQGDEDSGETIHETIRIYTISYNGEAYFADQVFHLSDDQKLLASQYAQNLTVLLGDGIYQGLSETEFSAMDLSYDGVVFADGETQVVYYNQLDERWKYSPYGTDTIGGYACGPTAMAIVISSLTSETIENHPQSGHGAGTEPGHPCTLPPPRTPNREYDAIDVQHDKPVILNYQCDLLKLSDIRPIPEGFRGSPIMLCFDYQTQTVQGIVGLTIEVRPVESMNNHGKKKTENNP